MASYDKDDAKLSTGKLSNSSAEHFEDVNAIHTIPTADLPDLLSEEVAYGPSGVKGLLASPYVFGAAFLASLGGFSFGYDQGVISIINVMPQFIAAYPELEQGGLYTGLMTAMLELGAFLGCFFMPWLADKISRKWALSVVVVIFCIGAIIQTSAQSYGALVFGRFFGGIGVGTLALVGPNSQPACHHDTNQTTGCTALHFGNSAAKPSWSPACARVRLHRLGCGDFVLDQLRHQVSHFTNSKHASL